MSKSKKSTRADQTKPYILPAVFDDQTRQHYETTMDQILAKQSTMVEKLADYLKLNETENPQDIIDDITERLAPLGTKLRRDDRPAGKNSNQSTDKLPQHSIDIKPLRLEETNLRNEIDLIPYILYEESELSLDEIQKEVEKWSYDAKMRVLQEYAKKLSTNTNNLRSLEHLSYTWDILCDLVTLRSLNQFTNMPGFYHQRLTPRYGYDIPAVVEEANLADTYEDCFDLSYELYSRLQALGHYNEAEYATLGGHRIRWKVSFNARQAIELYRSNAIAQDSSSAAELTKAIFAHLKEVHPFITTLIIQTAKQLDRNKQQE